MGVSLNSIIRLCDQGHLHSFKLPGQTHRKIPRAGLLKFMLEHGIPIDVFGELSAEEQAEVVGPVRVNRVAGLTDSLTSS
jgi:hypothetical protein